MSKDMVVLCDCRKRDKRHVVLNRSVAKDYYTGKCDTCGEVHIRKVGDE